MFQIWRGKPNLQRPVITVVMPHFCCEEYVASAINSILAQKGVSITLIFVDDNSPSQLWQQAVKQFSNLPNVIYLRTNRNVGPYRIKNRLLAQISTPYIAFQDADDISHPDRLRLQIECMELDGADIVGCDFHYMSAGGTLLRHRRLPRNVNLAFRMRRKSPILHAATVVRRAVFGKLGGFDGCSTFGADSEFFLRAKYVCKIRNVRQPLYFYRIRPESLTSHPTTGFGSHARSAYLEYMGIAERQRLSQLGRGISLNFLNRPNDVNFEILPCKFD